MQVIQLQGDQRKNVSTFLVQVSFMFCLNYYVPNNVLLYYETVLYSLTFSTVLQTGWHCKEGEYQASWFLRLIKSMQFKLHVKYLACRLQSISSEFKKSVIARYCG